MGKIARLDKNMVNMIAAGEVIERPASAVKELLENAIDAGATSVTVEIENGGKKLIRITDNGSGMDTEDLELAFEPHATSKISSPDDLDAIVTLGFRGEALASIASVAQVRIVTRTADEIEGHALSIDCGVRGGIEPVGAPKGTDISIRNLFYKLPARRKFLRTDQTEMSHITDHFTRVALVHTNLEMRLIHNGRQVYHLLAGSGIRERIRTLLGEAISEDLIETQNIGEDIEIRALIGRPASAKATTRYQFTFLNGRYIRDKFIQHAIREGYRGTVEHGRNPAVFMYISMDPNLYDVNVHPTKAEVRFERSNWVYSHVLAAIREKLLSMNVDAAGDAARGLAQPIREIKPEPDIEQRQERVRMAMAEFFKNKKPVNQGQFEFPSTPSGGSRDTQTRSRPVPASGRSAYDFTQDTSQPDIPLPPQSLIEQGFMQIHDSYIVHQTDQGVEIIDQHALHERILYEKMATRLEQEGLESQRLLVPESFSVTNAQQEAIENNLRLFSRLGIELTSFGPGSYAVQAFPTMLSKVDAVEFVTDMLDKLTDDELSMTPEKLLHEILDMASCKAAIKAGQKLTPDEILKLLTDKQITDHASRCPHGRPTTLQFSLTELAKQFKRT